jgi:hypothetical protein
MTWKATGTSRHGHYVRNIPAAIAELPCASAAAIPVHSTSTQEMTDDNLGG